MTVRLEVCVDSLQGCRAARAGGADRVELCAGLVEGGTTPSAGLLEAACELRDLEVVALIRPRAGDFLYDADELHTMGRDVDAARAAGARAVALGVLTADGAVDRERCAELIARARPMEVCFHRAFDRVADPHRALEVLAELGVDRILTSGQAPSAEQGLESIAELVRRAPPPLSILPGGGVRPHNAARIVAATGARELHFSAREARASAMTYRGPELSLGSGAPQGDYELLPTSAERVRAVREALVER